METFGDSSFRVCGRNNLAPLAKPRRAGGLADLRAAAVVQQDAMQTACLVSPCAVRKFQLSTGKRVLLHQRSAFIDFAHGGRPTTPTQQSGRCAIGTSSLRNRRPGHDHRGCKTLLLRGFAWTSLPRRNNYGGRIVRSAVVGPKWIAETLAQSEEARPGGTNQLEAGD